MAQTFVAAGAWATGSQTTVTPALPSGWAAGDQFVVFLHHKTTAATISTPTGWTVVTSGSSAHADGYAADTGNTKTIIYTRTAVAGDTAPTFNLTGGTTGTTGNNLIAQILAVRPGTGMKCNVAGAVGPQTTSSLSWSASVTLGTLAAGDALLGSAVTMSDTPNTSAFGVTQTGATIPARTALTKGTSATGSDIGVTSWHAVGVTGTGTVGTATLTATSSATAYGTHGVVRLREEALPVTVQMSGARMEILDPVTTELVVAVGTHAHATSAAVLEQQHELPVADGSHAHTATEPAPTVTYVLAADDGAHAHASDAPALEQAHALGAQVGAHAHASDAPALTQEHALAAADAPHAHTTSAVVLTGAHLLAGQDGTHAHAADSTVLVQQHTLAAAGSGDHAHAADGASLVQQHALAVADTAHEHAADEPSLIGTAALTVADGTHAHTADAPALQQTHALAGANTDHAHTADPAVLTQSHALAADDGAHAHAVDHLTVTAQAQAKIELSGARMVIDPLSAPTLSVDTAAHAHVAQDDMVLEQQHQLAAAAAVHSHQATGGSLTSSAYIVVAETVLRLPGTPAPTLVVDDTVHDQAADAAVLALQQTGYSGGYTNGYTPPATPPDAPVGLTVVAEYDLAVADGTHDQAVDEPALAQQHSLTIVSADSLVQTATTVALDQLHLLLAADSAHPHTATALALVPRLPPEIRRGTAVLDVAAIATATLEVAQVAAASLAAQQTGSATLAPGSTGTATLAPSPAGQAVVDASPTGVAEVDPSPVGTAVLLGP